MLRAGGAIGALVGVLLGLGSCGGVDPGDATEEDIGEVSSALGGYARVSIFDVTPGREPMAVAADRAMVLTRGVPYEFHARGCASDAGAIWTLRTASGRSVSEQRRHVASWGFREFGSYVASIDCWHARRDELAYRIRESISFAVGYEVSSETVEQSPLRYTDRDFEPIRRYVGELSRAGRFIPEEVCRVEPGQSHLLHGEHKFACRLKRHPNFVFLFSRTAKRSSARISHELRSLAVVRDGSVALGQPVTVVPFDSHIISVACVDGSGDCAGYLEAWLDRSSFQSWHHYSNTDRSLRRFVKRIDFTEEGHQRLCANLRSLFTLLTRKEFVIYDAQGFIGLPGTPDEGEIIFADPLGAQITKSWFGLSEAGAIRREHAQGVEQTIVALRCAGR